MDISHIRHEYTKHGLRKADMDSSPMQQFLKWFNENLTYFPHNNAATLATANKQGIPSTRIILLKKVDENGNGLFFLPITTAKKQKILQKTRMFLFYFFGLSSKDKSSSKALLKKPAKKSHNTIFIHDLIIAN